MLELKFSWFEFVFDEETKFPTSHQLNCFYFSIRFECTSLRIVPAKITCLLCTYTKDIPLRVNCMQAGGHNPLATDAEDNTLMDSCLIQGE